VKIQQHAEAIVGSDVFTPDQITAALAVSPTSVSWKGTRSTQPMIPITNMWRFRAAGTGRVDDLILGLVGMLESVRAPLVKLTDNDASWVAISVMRRFGDATIGVEEDLSPSGVPDGLIKLRGQHQLLGCHLDISLMARLTSLGCSVDFDEYG
jgi:Domain of unknown function (DUF4279)